jgi:hypothetical protein
MLKKIVIILAATVSLVAAAAEVSAQDVLMNSAETINQGNIKLALFPTLLFGKNGGDSVWGVAGRIGYGLTPSFDIELKAATFKGLSYFGVEAEYWLIHGRDVNVSAALGGHLTDSRPGADSSGIDTTLLVSTSPALRLELYGIEYRISSDIDLLAEFGIALNDNARSYVSVGLALYLR